MHQEEILDSQEEILVGILAFVAVGLGVAATLHSEAFGLHMDNTTVQQALQVGIRKAFGIVAEGMWDTAERNDLWVASWNDFPLDGHIHPRPRSHRPHQTVRNQTKLQTQGYPLMTIQTGHSLPLRIPHPRRLFELEPIFPSKCLLAVLWKILPLVVARHL